MTVTSQMTSRPVVAVVASVGPPPHVGGIEAVVDTLATGPLGDCCNLVFFDTYRMADPERWLLEKVLYAIRLPVSFARFLRRHRPVLAHIHFSSSTEFWKQSLCLLAARMSSVPVIFHLHGAHFEESYRAKPWPVKKLIASVLSRANCLIALSEHWRAFLHEVVPKTRVEVLPNPIDARRFSVTDEWSDRLGHQAIAILGSLGRRKGQADAIRAMPSVLAHFPGAQLVLAGREEDPGAAQQLAELARALGVEESVLIVGPVSGNQKNLLLQRASIIALPSYAENMPIALLEGMSLGKPVIGTRVGAVPEMIHQGVSGFLTEPGDVDQLSTSIVTILGDPDLAEEIGRAAKAHVDQNWHVNVVTHDLIRLYRSLGASV